MTLTEALSACRPLIRAAARRYGPASGVPERDLETIGTTAAWEAWTRWDEDRGSLTRYASTRIFGAVLDELRFARHAYGKGHRRRPVFGPLELAALVPAAEAEEEERMTPEQRERWIARALAVLTPRQRAFVVRAKLCGMTQDQIAAEFGVVPGTVGATISHAYAKMREVECDSYYSRH